MADTNTKRAYRLNFLEDSTKGLTEIVARILDEKSGVTGNKPVRVITVSNTDHLMYLLGQKGDKIELPVVGVMLTNIQDDAASFNSAVARKRGAPLGVNSNGAYTLVAKVRPVVATFQLVFVTDDWSTLIRFVSVWGSSDAFSFGLREPETNALIPINCDRETSFSVPPRSPDTGQSLQYQLSTNVTLRTYVGYMHRIPNIEKAEVSIRLATDFKIVQGADVEKYRDVEAAATEIAHFEVVTGSLDPSAIFLGRRPPQD